MSGSGKRAKGRCENAACHDAITLGPSFNAATSVCCLLHCEGLQPKWRWNQWLKLLCREKPSNSATVILLVTDFAKIRVVRLTGGQVNSSPRGAS